MDEICFEMNTAKVKNVVIQDIVKKKKGTYFSHPGLHDFVSH